MKNLPPVTRMAAIVLGCFIDCQVMLNEMIN